MTGDPSSDVLIGIAANLAYHVLKAGTGYLRKLAFGDDEQQAFRRVYTRGFYVMLHEVAGTLDEIQQEHLGDLFRKFVQVPDVTQLLIDMAIVGQKPPLADLRAEFAHHFDPNTLIFGDVQITFDEAMLALLAGLEEGTEEVASEPDNPLFNKVAVSWLREIRDTLRERSSPTWETLNASAAHELFGSYVSLVNLDEIPPASDEAIQKYYEGAPLTWGVIIADGDVERDQQPELIDTFDSSREGTFLLCIAGEMGSGKSTFAWRMALEIARITGYALLYVRNNEAEEVWYMLEPGILSYGKPLIVLVDDVFRNEDARRALESLSPGLDIMIVASSRSNETPADLRLPYEHSVHWLDKPTPQEKTRVLEQVAKTRKLTKTQLQRFRQADSWLVMMLEISTGESLYQIVTRCVTQLKQQDDVVYRAFEYLCFATKYDLYIPPALLKALDSHGKFFSLISRPASKDLIFKDDSGRGLRAQHPLIAQAAMEVYKRDPFHLVDELIVAVDQVMPDARLFIVLLLRHLVADNEQALVERVLEERTDEIAEILAHCTPSHLRLWAALYSKLGNFEKSLALEHECLTRAPDNSIDWFTILKLVERKGTVAQLAQVIADTAEWLADYPQHWGVSIAYVAYLELIGRKGTEEQLAQVIADTAKWLAAGHPGASQVYTAYLGLVGRKGTEKQAEQAIDDTAKRLAENPQHWLVYEAYLGLVGRKGTEKQAEQAIEDTVKWLAAEHPGAFQVYAAYLGLVGRKGTEKQAEQAIDNMAKRLAENPQHWNVYAAYLGLVGRKSTESQAAQVIDDTAKRLADHPEEINTLTCYLRLIDQWGTREQKELGCSITRKWLERNPGTRNWSIVNVYGRLLYNLENYEEAKTQFKRVLEINKGTVQARVGLAWCYYHLGDKRKALDELEHVRWWAEIPKVYALGAAYHQLGRYYRLEEVFQQAELFLKRAIADSPEHYGNYWELGETYFTQEEFLPALPAFEAAYEHLPQNIDEQIRAELQKRIDETRSKLT